MVLTRVAAHRALSLTILLHEVLLLACERPPPDCSCACECPVSGSTTCAADLCTPERCGRARCDAGVDGGVAVDTAVDSGVFIDPRCPTDPTDPCWLPIEGPTIPSTCVILRAAYPERISLPDRTACGSGCMRWEASTRWSAASSLRSGWTGHDGHDYIWVFDGEARPGSVNNLLVDTEGTVVLAVSYPPPGASTTCWARTAVAHDGFAAFNVYWGEGRDLTPAENLVFYAPISEISHVIQPVSTVRGNRGREVMTLDVGSRGVTWMLLGGETQGVLDGAAFDGFLGEAPTLVDTDVVATYAGSIHIRSVDGTDTVLGDLGTRSIAMDALTDGQFIAWFDFADDGSDPSGSLTLNAGAYARNSASFGPRAVEQPPGLRSDEVVIGDGLVAHTDTNATTFTGYRVIELASREVRRRDFPANEQAQPGVSLYLVSSRELVFETWTAGNTMHPIYFVDPSSLPVVVAAH